MKAELGLVVIYAMAHFANLTKYLNKICIIWPAEACCRGMMGRDILAKVSCQFILIDVLLSVRQNDIRQNS